MKRFAVLVSLTALSALGALACGGDDAPSGGESSEDTGVETRFEARDALVSPRPDEGGTDGSEGPSGLPDTSSGNDELSPLDGASTPSDDAFDAENTPAERHDGSVDAGVELSEVSEGEVDAQDGVSGPDTSASIDASGADADAEAFDEPDGKPALADVSPVEDAEQGADGAEEDAATDGADSVSDTDILEAPPLDKGQPGWRMTFSDDFEGPDAPGDPCYDQSQTPAMCMDRYWSQAPCPEDVLAQLADLNKCVWSVYDIYNWMDWGKPFGTGINKLDRRSVRVEEGELVLAASLNQGLGAGTCGDDLGDGKVSADCPIHSGAVTSKAFSGPQGFQQAYGRWEVRARLPSGPGAWPAHWLLPQSGPWPSAGEIDIMEAIAETPNAVHGSFHGGTLDGEVSTHHSVHNWHDPEDARVTQGYHVYAVEWSPTTLRFFVDELQIGVLKAGTLLETKVESAPDDALVGESVGLVPVDIPDSPFHWILNTSIVPTGGLSEDFSNFVAMEHRIDWVRVYEACTTEDVDCEPRARHSARTSEDPTLSPAIWSAEHRRAHVGDFDGDGADDLLLRGRAAKDATYWVPGSLGLDTFKPALDVSESAGMTAALWADAYRDLVVGDFNGDGVDDVVMPPRGEGHAAYMLLGGASPFNLYSIATESWGMSYAQWSTQSRRAHAYDLTGDGFDDLLLIGLGSSDATLFLEADGSGGFLPPVDMGATTALTSAQWSDAMHSARFGDFNADGATDVLLQGDSAAVQTWMMLADGAGGFIASDVTETLWMSAEKWSTEWRVSHVGDFDGDGASDLLLQSKGAGHATYLLLSDTQGGFEPEQVITESYWMSEAHWSDLYRQGRVADFDGDGRDDILLVSRGEGHATYYLRASGQGAFEPVRVVTDIHMLSDGLWSTERHHLTHGRFDGGAAAQVLLQGASAEEETFWVDLRAALN